MAPKSRLSVTVDAGLVELVDRHIEADRRYRNWFDYKLEHDPRFLERVARARRSLRDGHATRAEDTERGGKRGT